MGIYDRDYMRRRPSEDEEDGVEDSAEGKAEALAGRFTRKHSGLLVFIGVTLVTLVILSLIFK
jgi:hypothetical protein